MEQDKSPNRLISQINNSIHKHKLTEIECGSLIESNAIIKIKRSILMFLFFIVFIITLLNIFYVIRTYDPENDDKNFGTVKLIVECMFSFFLSICLFAKLSKNPNNIVKIPIQYPIPLFIGFFGIIGGVLMLFFYIMSAYNKIKEKDKNDKISISKIINNIEKVSYITFSIYMIFVLFGAFIGKR